MLTASRVIVDTSDAMRVMLYLHETPRLSCSVNGKPSPFPANSSLPDDYNTQRTR